MLDFSDTTNRKVAGAFIKELLQMPLEHELDDDGNKVVIGDGINLGGDRDWAEAVSGLARKVYAAPGEFEEVVLGVVELLARPCRERTADFMQWMHCLSVTGLLLENTKSFRWMLGKSIEPVELLLSLLLPGVCIWLTFNVDVSFFFRMGILFFYYIIIHVLSLFDNCYEL